MDKILSYAMFGFSVVTLVLAINVLRSSGKNHKGNFLFIGLALSSSLWGVCFGFIPVQKSADIAYLLRIIGLAVMFSYMVFVSFFIASLSCIDNVIARVVKLFSLSCVFLYPFSIQRKNVNFINSSFGMSYIFEDKIINTLYISYCFIVAAALFYFEMNMCFNKKRKWIQVMGRRFIYCEIVIFIGTILDTILPLLGVSAFPGSSLTQSFGVLMIYFAFLFYKSNNISIDNMTEFVYYSFEEPLLIYNENEKLKVINKAAMEYFGIHPEYEDITLDQLFYVDKNILQTVEGIIKIDADCIMKPSHCRLCINRVLDKYKDIKGYIVIVDDFTDKVKVFEELEEAKRKADIANKAKSDFLTRMSHEIRTPLNTIIGMDEMVLRETNNKKVAEYGKHIKKAGEVLLAIIKDILDISKLEKGKLKLIEDEYNIMDILNDSIDMLYLFGNEKGIEVKVSIADNLPVVLYGDRLRIRQIVLNVSSNAMKYTQAGMVKFSVNYKKVDENNVKLSIEIEDTGRGIHKEDIDKLFVPYEHFDENENQTIEGTGLGLPIANDLVKLMGGNIEVKSQYGKGSKFIINILQKVVRWEEDGIKEEGPEQKNQGRTFIAPDARVLVVDDMPANLLVANELLKRTQIKVDMAKRGADCLKMIEKKSYQIIFLDHMMPEMDGIELLKRIREFKDNPNSSVPIIVMTANAVLGSREMYLDAGFTDYISKPVYYEELERLITKYLPDGMYTYIDTDNQESGKGAVIVD